MGSRTSKEEDSSTSYRALPTHESSTKFQAVVVDAKDATKKVAEPVSIRIVEPNTSNQGTVCAICQGAATKNIVFVVGDFPPPELPYVIPDALPELPLLLTRKSLIVRPLPPAEPPNVNTA